jgi:hypothetical protein
MLLVTVLSQGIGDRFNEIHMKRVHGLLVVAVGYCACGEEYF